MTVSLAVSRRALDGMRIVEIGHFIAAPFATRILADLGADIIKVESPTGDPARQWGDQIDGKSLWWSIHGRNKRSIGLDLKNPEAKQILLDLVRHCDAVIENFRPGQLEKLGLGPDTLRAARPGVVIAHISGYGQTGPDRDKAAFGVIGEAIGGLRYLTDHPPGTSSLPPVRTGVSIGDSISGLYAAIGVLAALWQRDRIDGDAEGRTIDVALTESVLSLMEGMLPEYGATGRIKAPSGGGIATAAPTNAYPTADGGWILIAANSEPLFERLARAMGQPELAGMAEYRGNQARVANSVALDALIGEWSRRYDIDQLDMLLATAGVPACKVFTVADIAKDRQFRNRRMVREIVDPAFDKPVLHPGVVPRIDGSPDGIRWPGPSIGAHSNEILREFFGLDSATIAALRVAGAVA